MKILAIGTCCVDVYPQKGAVTPGGEALNIAAQLSSRDDVEVYLMAMIGDDDFGDKILETIQKFNIQTKHLYQVNGETAKHVIQISKDYIVAVDFNDQRDFTNWADLFDDIDIFFSSAEESMKKVFLEKSKSSNTVFVLTFGKNGSVAYHKGQTFECEAIKVANVIDTTGCGDCYQGHFVAEYMKTNDIKLSMHRATLEAAKVTAHVGSFTIN